MVESRWLRWIGPGVVALGAVGSIATTTMGSGPRPWTGQACAGPPAERIAAAKAVDAGTVATVEGAPWFRLDPVLDGAGSLRGQRLAFGLGGAPIARTLDLAAESFAAGPFGRVLLIASDDGTTSRLEALDVGSDCSWSIAEEHSVIRRATIDPAGSGIYEARVDRATRADLGVWLRRIDGRFPARRILAPLDPDPRFGRTFSTELAWDLAGERLAVQSCGEVACRTRSVARLGGPTRMLDAPDLGPVVGLDGDSLVTYEACRGLPCPIVSTDLATGERRVLASAAGLAVLVSTASGPRLVHEAVLGTGRALRSVDLGTGDATDAGPIPDGLGLLASPDRAAAATRTPRGWVVLVADGRLPADGRSGHPQLRRIPDGATVPFDEAWR
jgi:hypothetical protein